jgi:hypothetical protein
MSSFNAKWRPSVKLLSTLEIEWSVLAIGQGGQQAAGEVSLIAFRAEGSQGPTTVW